MERFINDNFGNVIDRLSGNYLGKPVFESHLLYGKPLNPIFESKPNCNSKDLNGYGHGDTTSAGYYPNPGPNDQQPAGMPPLHHGTYQQPFHGGSCYPGVSQNGYFVPNADFLKPVTSAPLNINMPMHP